MCLLLTRAFEKLPFKSEAIEAFILFGRDKHFESPQEIVDLVEEKISELEAKLDYYDRRAQDA